MSDPVRSRNLFNQLSWYFFDMGNSAHAILISTVGFSIYFKSYLYHGSAKGNSMWAAITALILFLSAIGSPFLTSLLSRFSRRYWGLIITTVFCVITTFMLGTTLSDQKGFAVVFYILSALGYYLALPIYNSYLPNIANSKLQKISAVGWALGYLGGVLSVAFCLVFGYLEYDVSDRPDIYRHIFITASLFNLVLSSPLMAISRNLDKAAKQRKIPEWSIRQIFGIFTKYKTHDILRLLIIYWLIGEIAVIVTYFFAIFLKDYAGLTTKQIMTYFILGQIIAMIATWATGMISEKYGSKKPLYIIVFIWIFIPIFLFLISLGFNYWPSIILISSVIGSYHAIIRGRIGDISNHFEWDHEKGSLFGFLEVSGRASQVIGPVLISVSTLILPLNYAILSALIFPFGAMLLLYRTSMGSRT